MKTVLFSNSTPKICINRDFDYPKICITVERDGKINRLIRFDERGFDCSSHVIFDYTGANFALICLAILRNLCYNGCNKRSVLNDFKPSF